MENLILKYTKEYVDDKPINKQVIKGMLQDLYDSHRLSRQLLREGKIEDFTSEFSMSEINSESLFNSKYVSKNLKSYMDMHYNYKITYSFNIYHRKIAVIFYVSHTNKKIMEKCSEHIVKIITLLFFLSKYANKECCKQLKIHLPLTSLKKCLPVSNLDVIDTTNSNSAVTTSCTPNGAIIVYRNEEWFKTLTHELFHVLGLDFSLIHSDVCSKKLREELNIDSELLVYEAYCEFWATIINTLFFTYFTLYLQTDVNEISFEDFYNINRLNLNIETTFSLIQVIKVLSHMHLNYKQVWDKDIKYKSMRNMLYKENTNVFAYYILKTAMLVNRSDIFEWSNKHNKNILNFKETPYHIELFCDELIKISRKNVMFTSIRYCEDVLKQLLKKNMKKELMDKILHSLRMTLLTV